MKKMYIFALCIALTQQLSAQIILDASSYPIHAAGTTDTISNVVLSTLPAIPTGAGITWDFSGVSYSSTVYQPHIAITSSTFPYVQYYDQLKDSTGAYTIYQNTVLGINTSGLMSWGQRYSKQIISMGYYTGNSADTFKINAQDVVFSNPVRRLAFAASYPTQWHDTMTDTVYGTVTVPVMSFFDAPLMIRSVYDQYDSVVGWGVARVKNSAGTISDVNVLQVKSQIVRTDYGFINGIPITGIQKDYTGLPNSWYLSSSEYKFYMENEVMPLINISYDNFTTKNLQGAQVLSKNLPAEGIPKTGTENLVSVYPNPVTDHIIYVNLPNVAGNWTYELINIEGQLITKGKLTGAFGRNEVKLPNEIAPGSYVIRINCNETSAAVQKLDVK